jgi:tetratricopeptide (TPR) repeat protein
MRPEKKIRVLKNRIRQNPKDYKAYIKIGDIYQQYNNFNGAIQVYERALKIKPNDEINVNRLGEALWKAKRFSEALYQFKKALKINPKYPYAHLNLGKAFALVNDKENAIAHTRYSAKLFRKSGDKNGETKAKFFLNALYKPNK